MNFGRINMDRARELARSAGISDDELNRALEDRRIVGIYFSG